MILCPFTIGFMMLFRGRFSVGSDLQGEIDAIVVALVHLTVILGVISSAHKILQLEDTNPSLILDLADLGL